MHLMTLLALLLLSLAGHASGLVLGRKGRAVEPELLDLLALLLVWTGGLIVREAVGRWTGLGAGLALGLGSGVLLSLLTARKPLRIPGPAATGWRGFLGAVGHVQARLAMAWFFLLVVPPFALVARLSGDAPEPSEGERSWHSRGPAAGTVEEARRQW